MKLGVAMCAPLRIIWRDCRCTISNYEGGEMSILQATLYRTMGASVRRLAPLPCGAARSGAATGA
eukprot:6203798-Pleurochrysis_carterae.AAC.1